MNLQIEGIEGHRAQLTAEIDPRRLEKAKQTAARRISRQVNIRGFRKGKAPYRRVAQTVGEGAILEEALDDLGDKIYQESLRASGLALGGPGSMDDFKLEPAPTFVFTVPLWPVVDLKDYRDIRVDYEQPETTDEDVDKMLEGMRLQSIVVLDEDVKVTARGHRVHVSIESKFVDGEERDEGEEPARVDADDPQAPLVPMKGDSFVNEEDATFILDPDDDPFIVGFVENLLDCEVGSDVVFELTIPDDDAESTIIGRRIEFIVEIKKIEEVRIPDLDDEFAAQMGALRKLDGLDMAGLRREVWHDINMVSVSGAKQQHADQVLERMVDGAEMQYADFAVQEELDELVQELEARFKQQGLSIADFMTGSGLSEDQLREQYREQAVERLRQRLVMTRFAFEQGVTVDDDLVTMRVNQTLSVLGIEPNQQAPLFSPEMRDNIRNEIFMRIVRARLCAIGMGADPDAAQAEVVADIMAEPETAASAEPTPDAEQSDIQVPEASIETPYAGEGLESLDLIKAEAEEDDS